jgi:hypothetical protein
MKRTLAGLLTLTLLVGVAPQIAAAAVKAGATCTKLKSTTTVSGYKYTCIKSGKKLVWSKSVKIVVTPKPTATPTPSATATPTPTPSATATPTSTPSATATPTQTPSATAAPASIISFAELPTRSSDIQYLAWMAIQKAITSSPVQDSPIEIKVDANITKFSNKTSEAVRLVQKVFHGSKFPTKAWMVYYNSTDQSSNTWAASEFSKLMGVTSTSNSLSPRANSSNEAVVPLSLPNDDFTKSGGTEAHEYLHAVQFAQFVGSNKSPYVAPRWLFEGGGQFIQDFMMYGSSYQDWATKTSGKQLKTYDLKFFEDFLTYNFPIIYGPDGDPWFYTSTWPNQRVYDVGALVYQVLIAINGPDPVMGLFKDMSLTGNFDTSFKNIYGISWSDAKPYVAKGIFGIVNR